MSRDDLQGALVGKSDQGGGAAVAIPHRAGVS